MRLDLQDVNRELARLGIEARLAKGDGFFYFQSGEADGWLDAGVKARKLNDLTLKQWVEAYHRLREMNRQMLRTARPEQS